MSSRPEPPANEPIPRRGNSLQAGFLILIVLGLLLIFWINQSSSGKNISYSRLQALVRTGEVEKLGLLGKDRLTGTLRDIEGDVSKELKLEKGKFLVNLPPSDSQYPLIKDLQSLDEEYRKTNPTAPVLQIAQEEDPTSWVGPVLMALLPFFLILILIYLFVLPRMRDSMGGNVQNSFTKSPARRFEKGTKPTTFADVAGMENAKGELEELVEFLKNPQKFERLGAQVPKGVLLVGPPGTGKTLLARAVAGEAGVPFFNINGSEFIQLYVGVGASRVRDLFRTAKENSPCLLFIDEIDAIGRMRGTGVGGGSDEREQTLNQILGEMDGFQANELVIVIAATNRPDVLDSALLRPGRFDRHITIDRPTWQGRLEILKVHVRNKPLADSVDLEMIAKRMTGMTGADLKNLANEAALIATRSEKNKIETVDFERAADRVLRGPKREEILSGENKRRTAYHEAGHALTAWLTPLANKPSMVSIVPRGQALGVSISSADEERYHYGEDYIRAQLVMYLGGRAADRLIYNQAFAGHSNDLKQATKLARSMVAQFGMSDRLGPVSLRVGEEHSFLGKEMQETRDFSEGTATIIDEEVLKILREADEQAFKILSEHRAELEKIVDGLLEREELSQKDLEVILKPTLGPMTNGAVKAVGTESSLAE